MLGIPGSNSLGQVRLDEPLLAQVVDAVQRGLGYAPFDEQLRAASALHSGYAVEMDTGEGKTLAGAMAAAMLALEGRHVHVLSANDYLARRDAEWMSAMFDRLGQRVSWIQQSTSPEERRSAYRADVVYVSFSELGYDFLRDQHVEEMTDRVGPRFDVGIVDEADAVMIDEGMTPLVLAGSDEAAVESLVDATALIAPLQQDVHFEVDADRATVSLTDAGIDLIENRAGGVNLFDAEHIGLLTRVNLALHARELVQRDVDYLVADDGIRLINPARGRVAQLQRWPDGLQAAVEAKEALAVTPPGIILDQITVQDLLRRYQLLAGMSGTILAVADELQEFYNLPSGRIGRHRPNRRLDLPRRVYATGPDKHAAITDEIARRHAAGQPVLIGTQSVSESEALAAQLPAALGVRVLNARNDAEEAMIIARAGEYGAVTISTQMSGRGTDIRLGGADEHDRERVVACGGLAVIGTTPYPSTRLDLQLRGRAGRQGDPGTTLSFAAFDDELVQTNATEGMRRRMARGRVEEKARERLVRQAQTIAESVRLDRHRSTWQYTRALSRQRAKVLRVRDEALAEPNRTRRLVTLFCLDEQWQGHLARLAEIRDGIHLRRLAGQNPVDEFHRIALREFASFFTSVDTAVRERLQRVGDGSDPLAELGLRRPSATWTYMLRDDPLGDAAGRAAAEIHRRIRGVWDRA
ncbi:accessory Sec system translocase SecA2 [Microbacterium protaetiae]|uniref:Protein translocase subunit SecA n=2 Tax=Microbacterium protaetiae TaxID=2509458 RepID=A0A4P6EHU3_9MICO|nr:accessory Sec system translocase SecA2 [Microbacterium protaetiae]